MADDVQRITGTSAKSAARLCNFVTSDANLLTAHIQYLDTEVAPVIKGMVGPWVDLFGYASRKGNSAFNAVLSNQRLKAVKDRISTYAQNVNFQQQVGFGDSASGPDASDNSGYYRAVDVLAVSYTHLDVYKRQILRRRAPISSPTGRAGAPMPRSARPPSRARSSTVSPPSSAAASSRCPSASNGSSTA